MGLGFFSSNEAHRRSCMIIIKLAVRSYPSALVDASEQGKVIQILPGIIPHSDWQRKLG